MMHLSVYPSPRASFGDISLYDLEHPSASVDLSDNTNRWGMSPAAERALRRATSDIVTRYPEAHAASLKRALADYLDVDPACITTGCGSDDVLDSAIRAFGDPGDRLAIPDPSFVMLPTLARANSLLPVLIPLTESYGLDVDEMMRTNARIVYVCSPNNPTGTAVPLTDIERIAHGTRGLVIVDEAYGEFASGSAVPLTADHRNLLVVRTFSKAFGLAGLRVGFAVASPHVIAEVEKSRGPYKVNALAAAAAIAALKEGLPWMREHVALAIRHRARLERQLQRRQIAAIASAANFVLAPIANACRLSDAMLQAGVAVRSFSGLRQVSPALNRSAGSALRMSVGPWEQVQRALDALDSARRACV
jgi:histidinol-phosphate aminotransferase